MSTSAGPSPLDAERRTAIWRWILEPALPVPSGLTEAELLAVFGNSVVLLQQFRKTLGRVGQMYQTMAAQERKRVGG